MKPSPVNHLGSLLLALTLLWFYFTLGSLLRPSLRNEPTNMGCSGPKIVTGRFAAGTLGHDSVLFRHPSAHSEFQEEKTIKGDVSGLRISIQIGSVAGNAFTIIVTDC